MTAPDGQYTRVSLFMSAERQLTPDDVTKLLGSEITVDAYEVQIERGTVTNVILLDCGARIQVVIEQDGRACASCGHIYPMAAVPRRLTPVAGLRARRAPDAWPEWRWHGLPDWALVCVSDGDCMFRRMDDPMPDDEPGEGRADPGE